MSSPTSSSQDTVVQFLDWVKEMSQMAPGSAHSIISQIPDKTLKSLMAKKKRRRIQEFDDEEEEDSWKPVKTFLQDLAPTTMRRLTCIPTAINSPLTPYSPTSLENTIDNLVKDIQQEQSNLAIGLLKTMGDRLTLTKKLVDLRNIFKKDGKSNAVNRYNKFVKDKFGLSSSFLFKNRQLYEFCQKYPKFKLTASYDALVSKISLLNEWFDSDECSALPQSAFSSSSFWSRANTTVTPLVTQENVSRTDNNDLVTQENVSRMEINDSSPKRLRINT